MEEKYKILDSSSYYLNFYTPQFLFIQPSNAEVQMTRKKYL